MTVNIVQHVIGTTNGPSPYTLTIAAVAAGNVGCGFIYGNTTPAGWSVSDTSNSYTVSTTTFGNNSSDGVGIWPFYKVNVSAGTTALTFTHASDNLSACFIELHSTSGWTGFRNAAAGQNNTAAATVVCSTSLGAAGDSIVAAFWMNQDPGAPLRGGVSDGVMTLLDTTPTPGGIGTIAADSYTLNAAGPVTPSFNGSTSVPTFLGAIAALAFTPATGGAACLKGSLLLLGAGCWTMAKLKDNPLLTRRRLIIPRART